MLIKAGNNINTVTFTVVECSVGVSCASIPALAPLFNRRAKNSSYNDTPTFYEDRSLSRKQTRLGSSDGSTRNLHKQSFEMNESQPRYHEPHLGNQTLFSGARDDSAEDELELTPTNAIKVKRDVEWTSVRVAKEDV